MNYQQSHIESGWVNSTTVLIFAYIVCSLLFTVHTFIEGNIFYLQKKPPYDLLKSIKTMDDMQTPPKSLKTIIEDAFKVALW